MNTSRLARHLPDQLAHFRAYLKVRGEEMLRAWLRWAGSRQTIVRRLTPERHYPLNIGHPDRVAVLLVGCGGTGSFTAHILAQLASWALTAGLDLRLYYIDPDHIEEKNLVRQNFCRAELGQPKAFSLAWRYSAAFGLNIVPVVDRFSAGMLEKFRPGHALNGSLTLIVGAVDNFQARRDIAEAITERLPYLPGGHQLWWLDAGNERVGGQVLLGSSLEPEPILSPLGYCLSLPLPHLQEPSLLVRPEQATTINLSCADLTLLEEQSAMINRAMATWLGIYLYRLIQSRDLDLMATYLNLRTGIVQSTSITSGRVLPFKPAALAAPAGVPPLPPEPVVTVPPPAAPADPAGCPDCGAELIHGDISRLGILIGVRFCARCTYRVEVCPACGLDEPSEDEIELDRSFVPVLICDNCGWYEPLPPEFRQALPRGGGDAT